MMASEETMDAIHLTYEYDQPEDGYDAELHAATRTAPPLSTESYTEQSEERRTRERWVKKVWEKRRRNRGGDSGDHCRLLVRPMGRDSGRIRMDMDEVKACRDLGIELPCDWAVEIPGDLPAVDMSSGGNSPIANWTISSPGDDPKEVKARLKVWAQAVALASASRR